MMSGQRDVVETTRLEAAWAERDKWVRLFNRLDAAISHHKRDNQFADLEDEALWNARDRILHDAGGGTT
jgi:hypothetical protein